MNCFGVQFPVQPAMASLMALGDQRMRARAALAAGVRQEAQLRAAQPRGCEQRSELPTKSGRGCICMKGATRSWQGPKRLSV